jgi:hypothetical protein
MTKTIALSLSVNIDAVLHDTCRATTIRDVGDSNPAGDHSADGGSESQVATVRDIPGLPLRCFDLEGGEAVAMPST